MIDERLLDLLKALGLKIMSYSGRFMYGDTCLGFVVDRDTSLYGTIANLAASLADDGAPLDDITILFSGMRSDDLGLDTICYFPHVDAPESEAEDRSDDHD